MTLSRQRVTTRHLELAITFLVGVLIGVDGHMTYVEWIAK